MALTKTERHARVHAKALLRHDKAHTAAYPVRQQCVEDRRFGVKRGAQWIGDWSKNFGSRAMLEFNKTELALNRISNEYRNNRISIEFVPKDGSDADDFADALNSYYRGIESELCARLAFDNAFDEGMPGGYGAVRVPVEDEDEFDDENERLVSRIRAIYDADTSVYWDPDAKSQDKSDAKYCFVVVATTPEAYREKWGDDNIQTWSKDVWGVAYDWVTPDMVYVAEYYTVEHVPYTVHVFQGIDDQEERYRDDELTDEVLTHLETMGSLELRQIKKKEQRCHKYILSGSRVLEDCGFIPGRYIPIVPFYGKRKFIDNVEYCYGHVRHVKDAQRLKNMQLSYLAEIAAIGGYSKAIVTPEQIEGHEQMWASDNVKRWPYLKLNPVKDASGNKVAMGPIGYTKAPELPPALAALLQLTEADMADLLGNRQIAEDIQPNVSGKAIELVQMRDDVHLNIYLQNMAVTKKRVAEILLSQAVDIFEDEERSVRGLNAKDAPTKVTFNQIRETDDGQIKRVNELSRARYDVIATVGPSSDTKRQATVRALTGVLQMTRDQDTSDVLNSMIMMNLDGEGVAEVREYFRLKLIRKGALKPESQAEIQQMAQEAQNAQPPPEQLYYQAAADQAVSEAAAARASTFLQEARAEEARAKVDKLRAETVAAMAKIDRDEERQAVETISKLPAIFPEQVREGQSAPNPGGPIGELESPTEGQPEAETPEVPEQ